MKHWLEGKLLLRKSYFDKNNRLFITIGDKAKPSVIIEIEMIDDMPEQFGDGRLNTTYHIAMTATDLAELEKTNWLNNEYRGQSIKVHLLPKREQPTKRPKEK